jgi:GT2 family glycosyltransferase
MAAVKRQSEPKRLSIVIPSRFRPDLLRLCLTTVCESRPPGTQVIVVDDGSAGGEVARVAATFAHVDAVYTLTSRGFAAAANRGIAAATGDIIELLNDDTQVTPGWADAALRWFDDPKVAAVAPLVLQAPRGNAIPVIDSAGDDYDRGGFARKRGHGEPICDRFRSACEVFGASASSAFYRADVLRAVGGFPEHFGAYFEDVDLAWRVRRAGYRSMYEPKSIVWHRVGSSYRNQRTLLEQQSQNEERVFWRNVPDVWRMLPRHAAVLAGKAVRRVREGTLVPWAVGRLRAFAEVPGILRGRAA